MSFQYFPDFHRIVLHDKKLRVPKRYVEKYWKGISNPIFLRLPNGIQQEIFWVEKNGDIWFQKNWENFAKSFKYGYLLTFKHMGGSYFKVKIFGANALEVNYSTIKCVDEVLEDTKEEIKENVQMSDDSEIPKKAQRTRNGKRKMNMDFDTTQQKISSGSKVGMVKKSKKNPTIEAVNENPFFEVKMTRSYANGYFLKIPCDFSRKYLKEFKGMVSIRVGDDMPMEVKMKFDGTFTNRASVVTTGWKLFVQKYNLQVGDVCKFVMTQLQPLSFTITITPASKEPSSKKLKMQDSKSHIVMKHKPFKIVVNSKYPSFPKEFMKRGCDKNSLELKMGEQSWFVEVRFFQRSQVCKFGKGWRQFTKECKVEIGDTCHFELIDERKFVFDVSIVGKNPLAVCSLVP